MGKSIRDKLFARVCIVLAACSVTLSMACAGELLSAKALQDAYRRFCPSNVSALKEMLEGKNTKLQGSDMTIVEAAAELNLLKCDYASDPLYASLGNPDTIKKVEAAIRKVGIDQYIDNSVHSDSVNRRKYGIEAVYELANSKSGLSRDEFILLLAYAKAKARGQSVIWVLNPRRLPN